MDENPDNERWTFELGCFTNSECEQGGIHVVTWKHLGLRAVMRLAQTALELGLSVEISPYTKGKEPE